MDGEFVSHLTPFLVSHSEVGPDLVWYAPSGQVANWPRPYPPEEPEEIEITGIGWLAEPYPGGQLFVAIHSDGAAWLERWTLYIGVSPWNVNPIVRGTPCAGDPSRTDCLGTVTALPGTTLIAYTETNPQHTLTYLVVFDTESGDELRRVPVAEAPMVVTQLHASSSHVVVNLATAGEMSHLAALLVTVESGAIEVVPLPGMATIVG
jgi:hypothetical protein